MAEALSRLWCSFRVVIVYINPWLMHRPMAILLLLPNQLITPFTTPEWLTLGGSLPLLTVRLSASVCVFDSIQRRGATLSRLFVGRTCCLNDRHFNDCMHTTPIRRVIECMSQADNHPNDLGCFKQSPNIGHHLIYNRFD